MAACDILAASLGCGYCRVFAHVRASSLCIRRQEDALQER